MTRRPNPDAPLAAQAYGTILPFFSALSAVLVPIGLNDTWIDRLPYIGVTIMVVAITLWVWRRVFERYSTEFGDREEAHRAAEHWRLLHRVGLGELADEAWRELARASLTGSAVLFDRVDRELTLLIAACRVEPNTDDTDRYIEQIRAFRELGEDPE